MRIDAIITIPGDHDVWALDADTLVQIDQLRDRLNPSAFVNGAEITGILADPDGVVITGDVTFSYVSGTNGRYVGTVPGDDLALNTQYTLTITVTIPPS